eukprot:RCo033360
MAGNATKRLMKELEKASSSAPPEITVEPKAQTDLFNWQATIRGPATTPYEGGRFTIEIKIPPEYPFKAPIFRFTTKIFHPSVKSDDGSICGEIFSDWKPSVMILDVLADILKMLREPSHENALEPDIGKMLREDKAKFVRNAKDWTKRFAK